MKSSGNRQRIALGLDLSTQSLSAAAIDIDGGLKIYENSLDFVKDPRLAGFGLSSDNYILPTEIDGEANQPVKMYLSALDALFTDMAKTGFPLNNVVVINVSGQQHGHLYLNHQSKAAFARLHETDSAKDNLPSLLGSSLAYDLAPIWMTSNTREQAAFMRDRVGGQARMIELSGSDVPLRFSGVVMRRISQTMPEVYQNTSIVQLISSFIPAVLTGNFGVPVDFGNACGMSLMNYYRKTWSTALIDAASSALPGGAKAFRKKLPDIVEPTAIVGTIATYFTLKYGFQSTCQISAGSGDNPQSKVLVTGDLLSLGSSIVYMTSTDGKTIDRSGLANAMYDGIGRPFIFSCRTNGALVWDHLRVSYGLKRDAYAEAERILSKAQPGLHLVFWQPRTESFPPSGSFAPVRIGEMSPALENDYSGLIETTLSAVYYHSRSFSKNTLKPL
ncbi:MAG TPA: FGGY family carbohydrate kinase, partial [Dehalococcoidales bacterium]|nr:FGGY family carbohydrate kinase [Dehalococcoidales bacterium]